MKQYIYLFLLILIVFLNKPAHSQEGTITADFDPEIMKSSYYINGIYLDINQFWHNSPEFDIPMRLTGNRLMYLDKNANQFRRYAKPNWVICINNKLYIKHEGKYAFVEPIGRFSFFENHWKMLSEKGVPFEGSPFTVPDLKTQSREYFIDFKTIKSMSAPKTPEI